MLLSERTDDPQRPLVTESAPLDILLQLLCNTYMNHLLDPRMRSQEFETLQPAATKRAGADAAPHEDVSRISQLCRVICADLAEG